MLCSLACGNGSIKRNLPIRISQDIASISHGKCLVRTVFGVSISVIAVGQYGRVCCYFGVCPESAIGKLLHIGERMDFAEKNSRSNRIGAAAN